MYNLNYESSAYSRGAKCCVSDSTETDKSRLTCHIKSTFIMGVHLLVRCGFLQIAQIKRGREYGKKKKKNRLMTKNHKQVF